MKFIIRVIICTFTTVLLILAADSALADSRKVKIETTKGDIIIALDEKAAPQTVANFLSYVGDGFYDGTIFHRVIKGFMIQGGGFSDDMKQKPTKSSIMNEADNGLKNVAGTIAMARTPDPHSATAQFFINTADNNFLNFKNKSTKGWGYCVFGKVIQGMETVKEIENCPTGLRNGFNDVPLEPVIIKHIVIMNE